MVSISNVSAGQASTYYSHEDYYFGSDQASGDQTRDGQDGQISGEWWGKGAEALGLSGQVQSEDWQHIIAGQDKDGNQLIAGGGEDHEHRAGVDLTFSAPKSVSLLVEIVGDEKVREAHDKAVTAALDWVQDHYAQARETHNGKTEKVDTGNLVVAKYEHHTSRELDPQLHTHAVVANMTQRDDGKWRAVSNEQMYKDKMLIGQVYRNELANNLKEIGYNVKSDSKGLFEVKGIDQKTLDHFSQRKEQIDNKVKELKESGQYKNANDQKLREIATLESRKPKDKTVDMNFLREDWKERLREQGQSPDKLIQAAKEAGRVQDKGGMTAGEMIKHSTSIQTERESTFSRSEVLRDAGRLSVGQHKIVDLDRAFDAAVKSGHIRTLGKDKDGQTIYTTKEMQRTEKEIIGRMQAGQGRADAVLTADKATAQRETWERGHNMSMTAGQRDATQHILTSKDKIIGVQGDAGTGKTTMLSAVKDAAEKQGWQVRGLAVTGKAAAEIEAVGIKSETVDKFLSSAPGNGGNNRLAQLTKREAVLVERRNHYESKHAREWLTGKASEAKSLIEAKPLSMTGKYQRQAELQLREVRAEIKELRKEQGEAGKQLWVIDEASMLGSKKTAELLRRAEAEGAKVAMVGDVKQLQSIDAGGIYKQMQERGMATVRMSDVQRQRGDEYKAVVREMSDKRIDKAIEKLDQGGKLKEIGDRGERMKGIVDDYMRGAGKPGKGETIIVTARNKDRNELNEQIRGRLQERGLVGIDKTLQVREVKNVSTVDRHFATAYEPGNVVVSNKAGVMGRAGAEGVVISKNEDKHIITIQGKKGDIHAVDVSRQGQHLQVYESKNVAFGEGDKVVFGKNDRGLGVKNGQTGRVESVDNDGRMKVKMDDGKTLNINTKSQYNYVNHGYAVTDYKSQGQTADRVIYHADTGKDANYNQAYVAITRGREEVKIYTDNKEELGKQMKDEQVKTSTLDYGKGQDKTAELSRSAAQHER